MNIQFIRLQTDKLFLVIVNRNSFIYNEDYLKIKIIINI